jgi:diaminopimelate epimerase
VVGNPGAAVKPGKVFYKMSGSGNDFLVFDGRYVDWRQVTPAEVRRLCARRTGVGADGAIVLDPAAPPGAHFTFRFWNSDGSEGPMCGNGALCATRLARILELAPPDGDVVFATTAGLHRGRVVDGRPEILLPDCPLPRPVPEVSREPGEPIPTLAVPSVPHLVLRVADVEAVELERRGPALRNDPAVGPGGANVNWVAPAGDGTFRMRTYERGVEGETMACGTGAIACALSLSQAGDARPPVRIQTRSGLPLDINWIESNGLATSVTLRGEGRLVFRGIIGEAESSA